MAGTLAGRRCRGEVGAYSNFGRSGDRPVVRVARTSGGKAKAILVKGLVAPIGDALLQRRADGALVMRSKDGPERVVAPPEAAAVLYARTARTDAFILAHAGKGKEHTLWLHRGAKRVRIPGTPEASEDEDTTLHGRFWPYPDATAEAGIIDFVGGVLVVAPGRAVAVHGARALLWRSSGLVIRDLATGKEWPMPGKMKGRWHLKQAGPALAEGGRMIHLSSPERSGWFTGKALGVAKDGRVLIGSAKKYGMVIGPLRWTRPGPR